MNSLMTADDELNHLKDGFKAGPFKRESQNLHWGSEESDMIGLH
jgi:hypothetical protein